MECDLVNICGIPYRIVECEDKFDLDTHFGMIDYRNCEIRINKDLADPMKQQTLIHEMIHGMLFNLGYSELMTDEQFVQALASAIYQGFEVK